MGRNCGVCDLSDNVFNLRQHTQSGLLDAGGYYFNSFVLDIDELVLQELRLVICGNR